MRFFQASCRAAVLFVSLVMSITIDRDTYIFALLSAEARRMFSKHALEFNVDATAALFAKTAVVSALNSSA